MKKTSKTIVFFGNERLATGVKTNNPTVRKLLSNGYEVAQIFIKREGTPAKNSQLEIEELAESEQIPLSLSRDLDAIEQELKSLKPDIGVLVAYGVIIPQSIINLFPHGIINIHPSLLPDWRGPTPIEQTILNDIEETGVSIMQLVAEMDAGPLLSQEVVQLSGKETKQQLADLLLDKGSDLLIELLPKIFANSVNSTPQSGTSRYCHKIQKSHGIIDWQKSAIQLEREIRAYAGWPKSQTNLGNKQLIITDVTSQEIEGPVGKVEINDNNELIVYCSTGSLNIKRLQPVGKKEMSVDEFLRGYKNKL